LIICVFFIFPSIVLSVGIFISSNKVTAQENEIIIEDAEFVFYNASSISTDLVNTAKDVTPRVVVEYGESIFEYSLEKTIVPANFAQIIAEYTDSVFSWSLERPPAPLTSPPTTNITLIGETGLNGWFTSNVKVNMSANVPVEKTEYSLDNVTWFDYTDPFVLTSEGYYHLYYRSIDKAGNIEPVKEEIIKIDKTPPSGFIQINEGALYTDSRKVKLTLNASDAGSGVSQMRFIKYGDLTPWEPYSTQKIWNLSLAEYVEFHSGMQSQNVTVAVYAQFMDNAGLISNASDTIIFILKIPTPVSLNDPENITKTQRVVDGEVAEYYSLVLTWSRNTDPDFLCYEIIWYVEPLQPTTGYVEEWYFKPHESQGGEKGRYLIYDQFATSFKIENIPTWCTKCYFLIRTFNKQWIFSDSNLVVAEFPSGSSGILPYTPWPFSTVLLIIIGGITVISLVSFASYRMYQNWKIAKYGIKHIKGKRKLRLQISSLSGALTSLIPIVLWLYFYSYLSPPMFVASWGINIFLNSIIFNILLSRKTTLFRRLTIAIMYVLYFSFLLYVLYISSGGKAIEDPLFVLFAISLYIPGFNIMACFSLFVMNLIWTVYTSIQPIPSMAIYPNQLPLPLAIASTPLYLIPILLSLCQRIEKFYIASRAGLVSKLIDTGEKYYNQGKLTKAAEHYVKALLTSLKINRGNINTIIKRYTYLTKNIIYQAIFSGEEKDKKKLKTIMKLQKTLKDDKQVRKLPQIDEILQLDPILEKAQANDLDFMVDYTLKDREFLISFLKKIDRDEIEISDLASKLGYSTEATRKLLENCIEKGIIRGILTVDKQKFMSEQRLREIFEKELGINE